MIKTIFPLSKNYWWILGPRGDRVLQNAGPRGIFNTERMVIIFNNFIRCVDKILPDYAYENEKAKILVFHLETVNFLLIILKRQTQG